MGATIVYTTGTPGAGKTYSRVRYLVDEFLPHEQGDFIHNLPLREEAICLAAACRARPRGVRPEQWAVSWQCQDLQACYMRRLVRIPEDVLVHWRSGTSGPWEYFADQERLAGSRLVLDEIHEMIGTGSPSDVVKSWEAWLGTLRHAHCTLEVITQDESRVHRCMRGRAGQRIELVDLAEERDPCFRVLLDDWYRLWSCLTRQVVNRPFIEVEYRTRLGRWVESRRRKLRRQKEYFSLYDSFTRAKVEHDPKHDVPGPEEVPRFVARNALSLMSRVALAGAFAWFFFFGGFAFATKWIAKGTQRMIVQQPVAGSSVDHEAKQTDGGKGSGKDAKGSDKDRERGSDGNSSSVVGEPLQPELARRMDALEDRVVAALAEAQQGWTLVVVGRGDGTVLGEDGTVYSVGTPYRGDVVVAVDRDGLRLRGGRRVAFVGPGKSKGNGAGIGAPTTVGNGGSGRRS